MIKRCLLNFLIYEKIESKIFLIYQGGKPMKLFNTLLITLVVVAFAASPLFAKI